MEKILITGGLGYLGRRLAACVVAEGGFQTSLLTRGTAPLEMIPECEVVVLAGSWDDAPDLLHGVDQVVHLGGPYEKQCASDPVRMMHESFAFTHGLVLQAAKCGVRKIIMASTIHVYGSALLGGVTEQTVPLPAFPYGIIKRACEDVVSAGSLNGGSHSIILRLSNGFGAPLTPDITQWPLLVNDLCRQAVKMRRMTLRSDPRTLRNFETLTDVCGAIVHFLKREAREVSETIHVGSSRAHSIGEMVQLVRDRCAVTLGFTPDLDLPAPGSKPVPELRYDIGKLRAAGFVPSEDFAGEIDATLLCCARWFGPP